jgi:alkylation response protein AidB-like acyl-CoA dehydrogenase
MEQRLLRNEDFSLDAEQVALRETFAAFFAKESSTTVVRAAEPLGFDPDLWGRLMGLGVTTIGVPESQGGDGAGLVELVLAAEECGRALGPVPFIETTVAGRILAAVGGPDALAWLAGLASGEHIVTLGLHRVRGDERQLVPAGAICDAVIALCGRSLVLVGDSQPPRPVANQACAPLAWWTIAGDHSVRLPLIDGADAERHWERALLEWKMMTAAALVGLSAAVLGRTVEHARTRYAFGVPIGSFQAVSHPLVDVLIGVEGARRLIWKAAWFAEHEPAEAQRLAAMAWVYTSEVATHAVTTCLHAHGGVGFTMESDIQLFFRRAKGWATIAGDPRRDLLTVADTLVGDLAEVS